MHVSNSPIGLVNRARLFLALAGIAWHSLFKPEPALEMMQDHADAKRERLRNKILDKMRRGRKKNDFS